MAHRLQYELPGIETNARDFYFVSSAGYPDAFDERNWGNDYLEIDLPDDIQPEREIIREFWGMGEAD